MIIMGLLQNTWARNPERVAALLAECPERRNERIAILLFWGCLTGRRLKRAFGPLCDDIIWENATPVIAGESDGCPPGDPEHVQAALKRIKPSIVLPFGEVAIDTLSRSMEAMQYRNSVNNIIPGPHPAARYENIAERLHTMRQELNRVMREMK